MADCLGFLGFKDSDCMPCRREPAYITMLVPFLRYLYCQPQRQPQHALLRHGLLRVLLTKHPGSGSVLENRDEEQTFPVTDRLLLCLCQLVPHMQVRLVHR